MAQGLFGSFGLSGLLDLSNQIDETDHIDQRSRLLLSATVRGRGVW